MLNVKNAEIADLEQIMKIYRYAQDYRAIRKQGKRNLRR